jgi:hypothetical protein
MVASGSCSFPIKPRGEPSQEGESAAKVTKSVAQYFEDQYKVKLQFPRLQCAVVRNNNRLPLEVRTAAKQGGLCTKIRLIKTMKRNLSVRIAIRKR